MNTKKLLFAGGILLFGALFYFISPFFRVVERNDPLPLPLSPEEKLEASSTTISAPSPSGISLSYQIFDTPAHPASGNVKIVSFEGKSLVRFENLETIDGPDVHIYLSKDLEAKEYIDLGEMKATRGNVNYEIPEGIKVEEYSYVLAWCQPFSVLFHYAKIK